MTHPNQDVPRCADCQHLRTGSDIAWCASPQILAAYGGMTRTAFERDGYDKEHNRRTPETRKCGPEGVNYQKKVST